VSTLDVAWAPDLVEATLLDALRSHADEHRFRRQRDAIYEIADAEARETAFAGLHARWFQNLGFAAPLGEALGERPEIAERCARALVARAVSSRDEAADLLVAPPARPTLAIRVRPETLGRVERALPLLRRELTHVADMLDPAFGYSPRLDAGARESLLRARYRVLWDVSVDGRLSRRGHASPDARAARWREFRAAFAELTDSGEAVFARLWDADRVTHAELLALAAGARRPECPLCRLPSHDLDGARGLAPAAVDAVRTDFPSWTREAGLCRRCAELYQARAA
jgi:hypothetical protein